MPEEKDKIFPIGRFSRFDTETILNELYEPWTDIADKLSFSASGSMTISSVDIVVAEKKRIRDTVWFRIVATFTTGGTTSSTIYINGFPDLLTDSEDSGAGSGNPTSPFESLLWFTTPISGDIVLAIKAHDSRNWALAASRQIRINGFYKTTS